MKTGIQREPKTANPEPEPEPEEFENFEGEFLSDEDASLEDQDFSVDLNLVADTNADDDEARLLDYMETTLEESNEDDYQEPTDFTPLKQGDTETTLSPASWDDQFLLYTEGNSIILYDLEHPSAGPIRRSTTDLRDRTQEIALCNLTVPSPHPPQHN